MPLNTMKSNKQCLTLPLIALGVLMVFGGTAWFCQKSIANEPVKRYKQGDSVVIMPDEDGESNRQSLRARKEASIIYFKLDPAEQQESPPEPEPKPLPVKLSVGDSLTVVFDAENNPFSAQRPVSPPNVTMPDSMIFRINSISEDGNRISISGMKTLKTTLDTVAVTGEVSRKKIDSLRKTTADAIENLRVETLNAADDGLAVELPDGGRLALLYVADPGAERELPPQQENFASNRGPMGRQARPQTSLFLAWKPDGGNLPEVTLPNRSWTDSRGIILGLRLTCPGKSTHTIRQPFASGSTYTQSVLIEKINGANRTDTMLALEMGLRKDPGDKGHDFPFIIPYGDWEPIPKEQIRFFDDKDELVKHPVQSDGPLSVMVEKTKQASRRGDTEWSVSIVVAWDDLKNERFQPNSIRFVFIDRQGEEHSTQSSTSLYDTTDSSGKKLTLLLMESASLDMMRATKAADFVGIRFERCAYCRCEFHGISPAANVKTKPSVTVQDFPLETIRPTDKVESGDAIKAIPQP